MDDYTRLLEVGLPVKAAAAAGLIARTEGRGGTAADGPEEELDLVQRVLATERGLADVEKEERQEEKPRLKLAASLRFRGDVQGVHLRATLHKILDEMNLRGMAYNDARSGGVFATIDADAAQRQQVLARLKAYMGQNPKVHDWSVEERRRQEKLQHVSLDDAALKKMFDRQGFTSYIGWEHDPAAYRRHWTQKRYRLQEDPQTHALTGDVPGLARRQLLGLEPLYHSQIEHPESFMEQYWARGQFKPVPQADRPLELPHPDLTEPRVKAAAADAPGLRLLVVKRAKDDDADRPFTVAVDLDGTLAEAETPFDAESIGVPRADVVSWVQAFHDAGARIIIWTVRGATDLVADWLDDHDVPWDHINENPNDPEDGSRKIIADLYIDDRAVNVADLDNEGPRILRAIGRDEDFAAAEPTAVVSWRQTSVAVMPALTVLRCLTGERYADDDEKEKAAVVLDA